MKLYIAGPMSGKPAYNFAAFRAAASQLRREGHTVVSPHELTEGVWREQHGREFDPENDRCDWGDAILCEMMKRDLGAVCDADAIVLLDGWRQSKGATSELALATNLGKVVFVWSQGRLSPLPRETALQEAQRLVHGDRQAAYGHPYDDYSRTARMWEALLGLEPGRISPRVACLMMVAVKLSREVHVPKRDNRVDGAGYFECADLCAQREAELRGSP